MPKDNSTFIAEDAIGGADSEAKASVPPLLFELVKAALTGLLANSSGRLPNSQVARESVVLADLTLKELMKEIDCERKRAEGRPLTRNAQLLRWPTTD